jgi:integrase
VYTIAQMNNEILIQQFMTWIANKQLSRWIAGKVFSYAKAILDNARNLGIIRGNAARLMPRTPRMPKRIKPPRNQPAITVEQFAALHKQIRTPRDRIILKILFLCALRRGEPSVFRWKDFHHKDGMYILNVERSFDSRTHRIREWTGKVAGEGKMVAKVVVPPAPAEEIIGWRKFGHTSVG